MLPIAIAVLSFAVYTLAVLTLHQGRHTPFALEEEGPFPAALSRRLYPLATHGRMELGVHDFLAKRVGAGVPAEQALDEAAAAGAAPVGAVILTRDGTGIGGIVMAEAAFALFGLGTQALPLFFLVLVGLSAAVFIWRYRDQRMSAVPTVLFALTLLLLTPLSTAIDYVAQAPVGGLRYYSVVGVLPALHWCLEFFEQGRAPGRVPRWAALGLQVAILGFAMLVRGSPAYLIGPVVVCAAAALWRGTARRWRIALVLLLPAVLLRVETTTLPRWAFPEYAAAGRLYGTVWHRMFVSFGENPAWPFAGVPETYRCPAEIPEGIIPGLVDRNAQCVWWGYIRRQGIPNHEGIDGMYGARYEKVLRSAFFAIVKTYPREAFLTFFYYKPAALFGVLVQSTLQWWNAARLTVWLCLIQVLLLCVFVIARPPARPLRDLGRRAGLLALFAGFGVLPQLIAWPNPFTTADMIAYRLAVYAIAVTCAVAAARWLLARSFRLAPADGESVPVPAVAGRDG
ncbi:MAG TPA: hypothetical protein VG651_01580 [Stellaceae bacterium]|nr:hypothetical protein [Stellaceae bacterium]